MKQSKKAPLPEANAHKGAESGHVKGAHDVSHEATHQRIEKWVRGRVAAIEGQEKRLAAFNASVQESEVLKRALQRFLERHKAADRAFARHEVLVNQANARDESTKNAATQRDAPRFRANDRESGLTP